MAEQEIILKADGLWTNPNELTAPQGGMSRADDVVSVRPGVVESRRGFEHFSPDDMGGNANELFVYQQAILAHYGVDKLARFDANGVKTDYNGNFVPPATGYTIQPAFDKGSLYFATNTGLFVLEGLTSQPKRAGLTPPVYVSDPASYASGSFLLQNETVGYRACIGYANPQKRIVLSGPSDVRLFTNTTAGGVGVQLSYAAIGTLTTSHFIQIYRTRRIEGPNPGEEFYLVLERFLTSAEAAGGTIVFKDIVPDELLGPPLYTNPSQESILQANELPVLAKTICPFAGSLLYGNTVSIHRKLLRMITIPREGDTVTIDGVTYTAKASPAASSTDYGIVSNSTVSENIRKTALNLCLDINGGGGVARGNVIARYISGPFDAPGQILLERPDVSYGEFNITADNRTLTKTTVTRSGSTVTANFTTPHGLAVGDKIDVTSNDANYASGTFTVATVIDADSITYTQSGTTTAHSGIYTAKRSDPLAGTLFNPQLPTSGTSIVSSNDPRPNGLYISKPGEPEASPIANRYDVGTYANDILLVKQLASSAFVFMQNNGLWRVTGDAINGLSIDLFDSTVELIAPRTVVALENSLIALTRKGVVRISEAGVSEPVSLAIEDQILGLYGTAFDKVQQIAHAVAYESEGLYILFMPSTKDDTTATQAFVYSVRSGGWTRWTKKATAAMVHAIDDKLYIGTIVGTVSKERKLRNSADQLEEDSSAIRGEVAWRPLTGESPATLKRWREISMFLQDDSTTEVICTLETESSALLLPLANPLPIALEAGNGPESMVTVNTSNVQTGIVRLPVPLDRCRASRLTVKITHDKPNEKFSCSGLAILMRTASARTRK